MKYAFSRRQRGAAVQQYAVVVGLIAVVALAVIAATGRNLTSLFNMTGNQLSSAANAGTTTAAPPPTAPDPGSPNAFGFTNLNAASPSTVADSNAVTLTGFTGPLTATCGGNCSAINRNGTGWQGSPVSGFMPGDTIAIRQNTSNSQGTTVSATVTLGSTTSTAWQVTTVTCPTASSYCNGSVNNRAAISCKQLQSNGVGTTGTYWLQPSSTAFQAYCDMTTEGGGWTLVASRSSNVAANSLANYADAAPDPSVDANRMMKSFTWTALNFTDVRYSVKNYTKNIYFSNVSVALQGSLYADLVDPMTGGGTNGCCTNTNPRSVTALMDSISSPSRTTAYTTSRQGWLTDSASGTSWCWWNEVAASNNTGVGTCDGTTGGSGYRGGVFVR